MNVVSQHHEPDDITIVYMGLFIWDYTLTTLLIKLLRDRGYLSKNNHLEGELNYNQDQIINKEWIPSLMPKKTNKNVLHPHRCFPSNCLIRVLPRKALACTNCSRFIYLPYWPLGCRRIAKQADRQHKTVVLASMLAYLRVSLLTHPADMERYPLIILATWQIFLVFYFSSLLRLRKI